MNCLAPGLVSLCLASSLHAADIVCLRDGRIYEDVLTQKTEDGLILFFAHGDILVPEDMILDCVADVESYVPTTDEEKEYLEKGYVRFDEKWMSRTRRDAIVKERIEARRAQVEEMKALGLWRNRHIEETKNFAFESTVPLHIFVEYRDMMEDYFQAFMKLWRVKPPRDQRRLKVLFYSDYDSFLQVTGVPNGVLGFFKPFGEMELDIFFQRIDPTQTEWVIYHEANHYLQRLVDLGFKYPHWPGESLAEYHAGARRDPKTGKVTFGYVLEDRVVQIQQDLLDGDTVHLEQMLLGCNDRNFFDYTWGWSLVHFLMEHRKHGSSFKKFFLALATAKDIDRVNTSYGVQAFQTVEGPEMLRAFRKYLGLKKDADFEELESEWHAYVKNLQVQSVRGFEQAAFSALRSRLHKRAARLLQEAIDRGSTNPLTFHRFAELHYDDGKYQDAVDMWLRAIEHDPLSQDYYVGLGRSMLMVPGEEERKEAERWLLLALELDESNNVLADSIPRWLQAADKKGEKN